MSTFCRQCIQLHAGNDTLPTLLTGHTPLFDWLRGRAATVVCEGCGCVQVDAIGNCASPDCLLAGEEGHGGAFVSYGRVVENDVKNVIEELDSRLLRTPLDARVALLVMNLWLRVEKAHALSRSIHMSGCSAETLRGRIIKIQRAFEDPVEFDRTRCATRNGSKG